MKTLKKTLCLVLAVVMAVGVLILPASAADAKTGKAEYDTLENYGIFKGRDNGNPAYEEGVRRDEVATIAYRLMTGDIEGKYQNDVAVAANNFKDSNTFGEWNRGPIGYGYSHELIAGRGNGKFDPADSVTGYELLAIMLRVLGYDNNRMPKELQGTGWTDRVFKYANQQSLLTGLDNENLAVPIARRLVAKIVYNTIVYGKVVQYNDITKAYTVTNTPIVNLLGGVNGSADAFGAPVTTYTAQYNFPEATIRTSTKTVGATPVVYRTAVTECDVAKALGLESDTRFTTYTNGVDNVSTQLISPLDTMGTIGAQGRETYIYLDARVIVYKDVVLSQATTMQKELLDAQGHPIQVAGATFTVWGNTAMDGLASPDATDYNGTGSQQSYFVEGNFTERGYYRSYILVNEDDNDFTNDGVDELVDLTPVTPVTVTVRDIIWDNGNLVYPNAGTINQIPVGFIGTDGVTYMYDVTMGYNRTGQIFSSAVITNGVTLGQTAIGKTYNVYTDGYNNVIGITDVPSTSSATYGVVLSATTVNVGYNATLGAIGYMIDYTILLPDNTQKVFRATASGSAINGEVAAAQEALSYIGNLVYVSGTTIVSTPTGNDGTITPTAYPTAGGLNLSVLRRGDPNALGANEAYLNDNTVFFIAQYNVDNAHVASGTAWDNNGYTAVKGFKNILDLVASTDPIFTGPNGGQVAGFTPVNGTPVVGTTALSFTYFVGSNGAQTPGDGTNAASYVLVNFAVNKSTDTEENVPDYAYVYYNRVQNTTSQGSTEFNMYKNGVGGQTLKLQSSSASVINANGSGLYTYGAYTNDGYGSVVGPVNLLPAVYSTDWTYDNAGVIRLITAPNGIALNGNTSNMSDGYLTVADDLKIYLVNPITGYISDARYDLATMAQNPLYQGSKYYFQLNKYGWIDLIYVVDNMTGTAAEDVNTIVIAPVTGATFAADAYVANYRFSVSSVTSAPALSTTSAIQSISTQWYEVVDGNNVLVTSQRFISTHRYYPVVTITLNTPYYFDGAPTINSNGAWGGTVDLNGPYTVVYTGGIVQCP